MPKQHSRCTEGRCYESAKNKGEKIMNGTNAPDTRTSDDTMKTYKCMTCEKEMLRNTFVCDICERAPREKNAKKHTELVREQYVKVSDCSIQDETWGDEFEGSQYWKHAVRHRPINFEGEILEHDQANPDFVSKERIEILERIKKSNIDWFKAVEMLKEAAEILDYEEQICVTAFANGKTLRDVEKKFEMSRMTAQRKLKSGLKKLTKFYEDKYVD